MGCLCYICADVEDNSGAVRAILSQEYRLDRDGVDLCMLAYASQLQAILNTAIFVEPTPWPRAMADMKGQLQWSSDGNYYRDLPIGCKHQGVDVNFTNIYPW